MRVLQGSDLEEAVRWMALAVETGKDSPCQRDKRGVVIVRDGVLVGKNVNAPPAGFVCVPKYCEPTCRTYAVHAEMNAIASAMQRWQSVSGATMYHARVENGLLQDSREPRCPDCSKHVIAFGIKEFVLKHAQGYVAYSAQELNELSLQNRPMGK